MSQLISLPWPDNSLSPNARVHWAVRARAVKNARGNAAWITRSSGITTGEGFIYLKITFHPPSRRRHDIDNCVARCKGLFDGIADGLGVDDSRFRLGIEIGEPVNGGRVDVEISNIDKID